MRMSTAGQSWIEWSGKVNKPARARTGSVDPATVKTLKGAGASGWRRNATRLAVVKTSKGPAKSSTSTFLNR
jgi:hypothetical protein